MTKTVLEMNLTRQVFFPGELIEGYVEFYSPKNINAKKFSVSLHGEEVFGADSLTYSVILPLHKDEKIFGDGLLKNGSYPFVFHLPEDLMPSYASQEVKCSYYITSRIERQGAHFDIISKIPITIIKKFPDKIRKNIMIGFIDNNIKLDIKIERLPVTTGDTIKGTINFEYLPEEAPESISIFVKAREKGTDEDNAYEKIVYNPPEEEIFLDVGASTESYGNFAFFIPNWAPISGVWNNFEICWEFGIRVKLNEDLQIENTIPIEVYPMQLIQNKA